VAKIKFNPRPYQELILDFAMNVPRCAVWAGLGLGKTSSTLEMFDRHYMMGRSRPTLVLAPLLVAKSTWPEEARKWSNFRHLRVSAVVGTEAERRRALNVDASIYVTNYENIPWLVEHYGPRWPFVHIVADESTRLKSFRLRQGGKRAQALASVAHKYATHFTQLTGTPAPNGLADLWGPVWFLDAGRRLGRSYSAFMDRWFHTDQERHICKPHDFSSDQIHHALDDITLSIRSEDWFDLDAPIVCNRYVELTPKARELYDLMEKEFFFELDGHEVEAFNAAAKSQKLLQLANGACYVNPLVETDLDPGSKVFKEVHDAKLQALDSIITEAAGANIMVAYNFKSDLARLKKAFPHGVSLTSKNSIEVMNDWNDNKIRLLFAHPQSAGHGLNLQHGGHHLVFFGLNWSLENRIQILERLGPVRQMQSGYKRNVFIYNILARDTVDELVLERVESKKDVQDILLAAKAVKRR